MLQGKINRFLTVACFRANVVIFLSFKNPTQYLADVWIVIRYQNCPPLPRLIIRTSVRSMRSVNSRRARSL
jgi:hypothetical protein